MMKIYLSYIVFNYAIPGFRCMIPSAYALEKASFIMDLLQNGYDNIGCHFYFPSYLRSGIPKKRYGTGIKDVLPNPLTILSYLFSYPFLVKLILRSFCH